MNNTNRFFNILMTWKERRYCYSWLWLWNIWGSFIVLFSRNIIYWCQSAISFEQSLVCLWLQVVAHFMRTRSHSSHNVGCSVPSIMTILGVSISIHHENPCLSIECNNCRVLNYINNYISLFSSLCRWSDPSVELNK